MTINQIDIKLLWGRAASRCAFPDCRIELTQDSQATSSSLPIGEQAHIVAKEPNGPRGESLLTKEERDSYANLILLCPTHHKIIDKNPEDYPVEKLHVFKTNHELWVQKTLSPALNLNQQAGELIYTNIIDLAVEYCHLSQWHQWTSLALEDPPRWFFELPHDVYKFRQKILSADFPGTLIELEKAVKTLSILLNKAANTFQENYNYEIYQCSDGRKFYNGIRFYKILEWNPERYHKLLQEYDDWVEKCHQLIIDATKAANWFREVVKRDINPMFFAVEGKFIVTYSPLNFSIESLLPEYTQEEKDRLPDSLSKNDE